MTVVLLRPERLDRLVGIPDWLTRSPSGLATLGIIVVLIMTMSRVAPEDAC